ncbi:MAG: GHKL domain-containing protein [Prevotellaceae bacterium]|jgi:signal transduction histidine kinase|nr:GHKL domain-containing protein [Prevotellaceae bacterium]
MINSPVYKRKLKVALICITLIIGVALLIISYLTDSFSASALSNRSINKLEESIHRQQQKLESIAYQWLDSVATNPSLPFIATQTFQQLESDDGMLLYGFKSDSLIYWSSKAAITEQQLQEIDTVARFVKMGSSWSDATKASDEEGSYIAQSYVKGDYKAVGLIWIRSDYIYENEFLQSRFNPSLPFPSSTFVAQLNDVGQVISGIDGRPLFTVSIDVSGSDEEIKYPRQMRWLSLLILLGTFGYIAAMINSYRRPFLSIVIFLAVLIIVRVFLFYNPAFLGGEGKLFSPLLYAASDILPSLGDLLLDVTFFMLFIVVLYRKRLNARNSIIRSFSSTNKVIYSSIFTIITVIIAVAIHDIFISLLHNSNLPLEPYRLADISHYTVIVYAILAMALCSLFLLQHYFITLYSELKIRWLIAASALLLLVFYWAFGKLNLSSFYFLVFYTLTFFLSYLLYTKRLKKATFLFLIVILTSLYILLVVVRETRDREIQEREIVALSLSAQRDPIAEALFRDLGSRLEADEVLANLAQNPDANNIAIYDRLSNSYFGGYFNRYNLAQVNVCSDDQMIQLPEENILSSCWTFYEQMIRTAGSNHIGLFHFLNHNNGRINYLGRIIYPSNDGEGQIALFIDLRSKSENQQIGYPELLLEKKDNLDISSVEDYNYAIYYDGKRVSIHGGYSYGFELKESETAIEVGDYYMYSANSYSHLLMKFDEHNVVIVSLKQLRYIDYVLSFSYVFLFFYIGICLYMWMGGFFAIRKSQRTTFKQRITRMLLGLLTVFFIATGVSMLWYNIGQYNRNTVAGIQERLNMVLFEFDQWFSSTSKAELEGQGNGLSYLLVDLSNIYRTDINVYTPEGHLLASSRTEIFDKGLQGKQINPRAYRTLKYENLSRLIDEESIGLMDYYSAYTPYYNSLDEELAIINLPYFSRQAETRQEITSLTLTVLNIFMLLVLIGFFIAVALSNRIARPLEAVRVSMRKLDLSGNPEPIAYDGKDELGDLVREYNRTTAELAESAKRLAQTERESAWREMARQIAHEIKNPLTPMKLSIQHVMRMKNDDKPGWQDRVDELAKSLIEQIDTLAVTASEFSNFAKLSKAELAKVNIPTLLREHLTLFAGYESITLNLSISDSDIIVMGYREQLQRVFTNLIKNAIQAIGDKQGIVDIEVTKTDKTCIVRIEDNGPGISPEKQQYLFQPNFTTKSGGTGLGLAISRNIIENIGGTIGFKSAVKGGAIFTVTIPLAE